MPKNFGGEDSKISIQVQVKRQIESFLKAKDKASASDPCPFHRKLSGKQFVLPGIKFGVSLPVSKVAGEVCRGVFNVGAPLSGKNVKLANYPGYLMTKDEYDELVDKNGKHFAYGIKVSLSDFLNSRLLSKPGGQSFRASKWYKQQWVVMGDPLAFGTNINTLGRLRDYKGFDNNCEFRMCYDQDLKTFTRGKFRVDMEIIRVFKQDKATINTGDELFAPYGALLNSNMLN